MLVELDCLLELPDKEVSDDKWYLLEFPGAVAQVHQNRLVGCAQFLFAL